MATIQRSLLIEASISACYAFWCDFERFPAFLEDVSRVQTAPDGTMTWDRRENGDTRADTVVLTDQVENRMLGWKYSVGPERGAVLTFAPLEGQATWFTFVLEYDSDEAVGDVAGKLTAVSRRLDRELRTARDLIEARAHERPQAELVEDRCD